MAKKLYEEASVQAIANAIREKNGEATTYKIGEMGAAIKAISSSPIVDNNLENTVQYRQMNASAAAFIANVDYTENANDYSVTKVTPYYSAATEYSKEEPDGLKIKVPANTVLTVAQGDKTRSDAVSGAGVIYNVEPLKSGTFAFGGKTYKIVPEGGVRMIYTPSVWNVRDLGGWACTGGRVKYGKIFRGGNFGSISADDKATIVDWLGVATDIDLRNNSETGGITVSPLGGSVEYFHQSLDFYANAVNTSAASARTVAVLKKVMSCVASNKPCYFHCMSGADRTGTIAYLLLSLLGVSQSDKDKDYELTAFSDEADGKRFRNSNYNVANGNGWYPLIKYFRDTYTGENDNEKVAAWAVANGITTAEINAFRANMISGNAVEVVVPPKEYTVTNTLTGCTSSNSATTITEGDDYYAAITASNGYVLNGATVMVKMGGTDVTALYYADGVINIPDVSGNIEITITAAVYVPSYTNVLPQAVDPSTKSGVWDGKGYRNGAYASSAKPFYGTDAACWCTGAIAVQPSDVIYVKGATLEGSGHERLGALSSYNGNSFWCKQYTALSGMATVTKLGDKYYKIVLDPSYANYSYIGYIMFSAQGTGDGVVVTRNEEIL
jgi:protein-tyrosine phosphatase